MLSESEKPLCDTCKTPGASYGGRASPRCAGCIEVESRLRDYLRDGGAYAIHFVDIALTKARDAYMKHVATVLGELEWSGKRYAIVDDGGTVPVNKPCCPSCNMFQHAADAGPSLAVMAGTHQYNCKLALALNLPNRRH